MLFSSDKRRTTLLSAELASERRRFTNDGRRGRPFEHPAGVFSRCANGRPLNLSRAKTVSPQPDSRLSAHGERTSESGDTGKIEVAERHRRHEKLAGFRRDRFSRIGKGLNPVEDPQRALVKPKILHRRRDRSILDEKRAVSGHTGQGKIGRIDRPDVPEIGHQDGALRVLDHFL